MKNPNSALDAVFIDDDKTQLASFGRTLNGILAEIDPAVHVEQIEVKGGVDVREQLIRIESDLVQRRPHLIFVDNQMNKEDGEGQRFIERLKPRLPDTLFCLLTRQTLRSDWFGLFNPNPDLILSKAYLKMGEPNKYKGYVRGLLRSRLKRARRYDVIWEALAEDSVNQIKDVKGRKISITEVQSVIEQVLFDGTIERPPSQQSFKVSPIAGGRSGSVVLGMQLQGSIQHPITGVLKISSVAKALEEIAHYGQYVKWVLPYTWRIDIIGTGFTENIGAVCYSFAFEGQNEDPPISASQLLVEGDGKIISSICKSIFDAKRKTWYSDVHHTDEEMSSYFSSERFYKNKKTTKFEEREQELMKIFETVFGDDFILSSESMKLFGVIAERPTKLVLTEDWGTVEECVSHGDLHCGNILVNRNSGALAFIDFQQTGPHYIFRDFVSVESSIRIDWNAALDRDDLQRCFGQEIQLAELQEPNADGSYVGLCAKVREAAFLNFPIRDVSARRELMLLGAYTQFSWLLTRFPNWEKTARQRLLLGVFASLVGLQRARDNKDANY
jgi:Phosphotransferase enzyme family